MCPYKLVKLRFHVLSLIPKGPNVHMADKPVLVNVTWAHTIFRNLETFSEDVSCSKLRGKKNRIFWIYGSKVMDVWSFEEKYGQGGHVLEPTSKSWLHQPKKVGSRNKESWEKPFESFLSKLLNLAPTLGRVKSSLPHGAWRFDFFSNFFWLNLEYTWTFIFTIGIFVSWKIEITKNSTSFASVMEIFCTPLQWRVHLSMFHSSSTSKIWQHVPNMMCITMVQNPKIA
jgi:hypothetical protein